LSDYYAGRIKPAEGVVEAAMQAAAQGKVVSAVVPPKDGNISSKSTITTAAAPASWGTYRLRLTTTYKIQIWVSECVCVGRVKCEVWEGVER
jgi:hypothetical protein